MSPSIVPQDLNPEWVRQGQTIKQYREMRGLKVGELANDVGISYAYLSNIEAGRKRVTEQLVAKIADALRVRQISIVRSDQFKSDDEQVAS